MAYTSLKSGLLFDDSISTSTATSAVAYQGTATSIEQGAPSAIDFAGGDTGAVLVTFNPQSLSAGSSNVALLQGSMLTVALVNDSNGGYKISILNGSTTVWTSSSAYDFGVEHTVAVSWSGLSVPNGGSLSVYLDGLSLGGKDTQTFSSSGSNPNMLPAGGYNGYLGMVAGFTSDVSSQLASLSSNPSSLKYPSTAANRTPTILVVDGALDVTERSTVTFPSLSSGQSINVAGLSVTSANMTATANEVAFAFASAASKGLSVSGTLSGFTAGSAANATVVFTSTTPDASVSDITVTASSGATAPVPSTIQGSSTVGSTQTEASTITFPSLAAGQSITVAGRVVTNIGSSTASANDVAAVFSSGTTTGLIVSGTLSSFTAGAAADASVVFTSTSPNSSVTDISVTPSSGLTVATAVTVNGSAAAYETDTITFSTSQAPKIGDTIYITDAAGSVNKSYTFASSDLSTNISGLVNAIGQKIPETQVLTIGDGTYTVGDKIKITYYKDSSSTIAGTSPEYIVKKADIVEPTSFSAVDSSLRDGLAKAATQANIASAMAQQIGGTLGVYKVTYDGGNKLTLTESSPIGTNITASTVAYIRPSNVGTAPTVSIATSQDGGSALLSSDGSFYRIATGSSGLTLTQNTYGNKSNLSIKYVDVAGIQESALGYAFDLADQTTASWKVPGLGSPSAPLAGLLLFGDLSHLTPSNQSSVSYGGGTSSGGGSPTPSTQTNKTNGPIYAELIPSTYAVANGATSATIQYNLFIDKSQDTTPTGYNSFGYTLQVDPAVATLPSTNYFSLPAGASFSTINDKARENGGLSVQWVALAGVTNYKTPVGTLTLNVPLDNGKAPANIGINFSDISLDSQYFTYATTGTPSTSSTYAETLIADAYPVTFTLQRNYDYAVKAVASLTTSPSSVTTTTALKNPGVQGTYVDYQVSNKAQAGVAYMHVEQATPVTSTSTSRGIDVSVHAAPLTTGETRTLVIDLPSNISYDTVKFTPTTAGSVTSTYVPGAHSITLVQAVTSTENLGTLHLDVAANLASPSTSTLMFNSVSKTLASATTVEAGIDLTSGYGVTDSTGSLVTPALPRGTLEYVLTDPALSKANTDKITVEDARAILGLAAGNPTVAALGVSPTSNYVSDLLAADFNNDGRVTGADVINLMNYVVSTTKGSLKWLYLDQTAATSLTGTKTSFAPPASVVQHTDVGLTGTSLNTMTSTEIKLTGVLVGDLVTSGA